MNCTERARQRPDVGWAWFTREIATFTPTIGTTATTLYLMLATFVNEAQECWPSHHKLASMIGKSRRTVITELQVLEAVGLVKITARAPDGMGRVSNLYRMLEPPKDVDQKELKEIVDATRKRAEKPVVAEPVEVETELVDVQTEDEPVVAEPDAEVAQMELIPGVAKKKKTAGRKAPKRKESAGPVQVYRRVARVNPPPARRKVINENVTNLDIWESAIERWLATGYSPLNVAGMVDWYKADKRKAEYQRQQEEERQRRLERHLANRGATQEQAQPREIPGRLPGETPGEHLKRVAAENAQKRKEELAEKEAADHARRMAQAERIRALNPWKGGTNQEVVGAAD